MSRVRSRVALLAATIVVLALGCGGRSVLGPRGGADGGLDGSNDGPKRGDASVFLCQGGQIACGPTCVDPASDMRNCGACGNVCAAGSVCSSGRCGTSCGPGLDACAGGCFDLKSAVGHCGACG